jgi:hypothetical protein
MVYLRFLELIIICSLFVSCGSHNTTRTPTILLEGSQFGSDDNVLMVSIDGTLHGEPIEIFNGEMRLSDYYASLSPSPFETIVVYIRAEDDEADAPVTPRATFDIKDWDGSSRILFRVVGRYDPVELPEMVYEDPDWVLEEGDIDEVHVDRIEVKQVDDTYEAF